MTYPMPTNLTGIDTVLEYANGVTDGYFGVALLIALYCVVFINLKLRGELAQDSFLVAGWISLIPTIFLFLMGLVNNGQMFIMVTLLVVPLLWSYLDKDL
tara:strand:- start:264 stop:563 length:300 start_codon:yes stop_codon:yes gene_type:complete